MSECIDICLVVCLQLRWHRHVMFALWMSEQQMYHFHGGNQIQPASMAIYWVTRSVRRHLVARFDSADDKSFLL